ncbi:MAG: 50S ribosomal protein L10 [Candidatus Marinamargulisbacteria bacterium]
MSQRQEVLSAKQALIDGLSVSLKDSDAIFFTEYRGLTVSQMASFRTSLREASASYVVMKNSLIKRTFSDLNIVCPEDVLKGPTALVVSKQDCPLVAAKLYKFLKTNEALVVKGGYLDGGFISTNDVKSLSKLPPKDVLIGQLVGGLSSTINRFVMGISSPLRGLVYSLDAIKNKKTEEK